MIVQALAGCEMPMRDVGHPVGGGLRCGGRGGAFPCHRAESVAA